MGADGSQKHQRFCSEQCGTQTVAKATITRSQHDYMLLRHRLQNALLKKKSIAEEENCLMQA